MERSDRPPEVVVAQGRLAGKREAGVRRFLGVPYAAPPVGPLRWSAPRPAAPWKGTRPAIEFAPSAPQVRTDAGHARHVAAPYTTAGWVHGEADEDCLYLNVWAPDSSDGPSPVLVWIHGGGFTMGSGSLSIHDGTALAQRGTVVVTINYRLGALGFLAHPLLTQEAGVSGNYGLLDVIAAVRWVNENIAAFNGDPARITIAGHSAGALLALALVASPLARGIFHGAIVQSGSRFGMEAPSLASAEALGLEYAEACRCSTIAELRALPLSTLTGLDSKICAGAPFFFTPLTDGHVLRSDVKASSDVPILRGITADEVSIWDPRYNQASRAELEQEVRNLCPGVADRMLALYPATTDAEAALACKAVRREYQMASVLLWAEDRASTSTSPTFVYLYDHAGSGAGAADYGSFHGSELPYVFMTLDRVPEQSFTAQDCAIARTISQYWTNFVRNGSPNSEALALWPAVDPAHPFFMEIGDRVGARSLTPEKFALFREALCGRQ
jgi:para-nitrobenzyl esterase